MRISKAYKPEACASTDEERININDAYLDVEASRVLSTNGHVLVSLPVEVEKKERSRYLAGPLLKAARALGDKDSPATIEDQELIPYGILWPATQMGREFIDWQEIIPKFRRGDKGTITIALATPLLASVAKAMGTGVVTLTIQLGRSDEDPSPIVIQPVSEAAEEIGVLMPYRAEGAGEVTLEPGQVCVVAGCGRLLAAGARCPKHGGIPEPVDDFPGGEPAEGSETTITLTTPGGKGVTATQSQMKAALAELDRRKGQDAPSNRGTIAEFNERYAAESSAAGKEIVPETKKKPKKGRAP